ncbi:unnamed protein product (macronuclear) [Paramecium tetraurelia]|uniref:Uncharacterized protein n=1 Tax=Paramecium tetraurelia TaxID=5888 RepID=A0D5D2_PARTE|nr:uncharacterized protein GSPATT00013698001 [Paramecium tetraurelia]CAK78249.1 unnamed protein product [Paramecium tetraurelia]|eukprot:XP_001445646.1 hypothetical protein (macronuclear) [Paramecium tetraurelia strain d4-2]
MDNKYIEEFEHLDQDQKSQMLRNMKQFISQLQSQIQDLEKSAIDIIMEKDEKIQQLEAMIQANHGSKQHNKDDEIMQLKNHINDLNQRIDAIQMKHFEQLQEQERKWNTYLLDQIQQSSNDGQQEKIEILETLHYLEEKVYSLDRELEMKENQSMFDRNTINQLTNINQQLIDESQELNQQLIKMQRQMELMKEHFQKEKNTIEIKINKQNIQISQISKQGSALKLQNNKLAQNNKDLLNQIKELKDQLETQNECKDKVLSENYQLQWTAHSTDQNQREDTNITAFELLEDSYEDKDVTANLRKALDEKSELCIQYEDCLRSSTKQLKEQKAQLQLLQNQLKIIRKQQFNQRNLKEYVQMLESDYLVSKQLQCEKADKYQEQVILLSQENYDLKQKIKCFQTRLHKKLN